MLEIDNSPVITQKLQNAIPELKKFFKEKKINLRNFKIVDDETLIFETTPDKVNEVKDGLLKKEENIINEYYPKYRAHKFDFLVDQNLFKLNFSKYGLVEIKNSSQSQALETIRRRVDEIGTNAPNILKRGNDRILVELPGLDNPDRITSLLGKTANLTFRFVTQTEEESFGTEKLMYQNLLLFL